MISSGGHLGKEAKALLKMQCTLLANKWGKSHSEVCGNVNARMRIAIIRAIHLYLRGSRVLASRMSNRRPPWESLFRHKTTVRWNYT
jgi:hypothetical protein